MPKKLTSKKIVIYLHDKTRPTLEEGTVFRCDDRGKIVQNSEEHFDSLGDIGLKIRALLTAAKIKWPKGSARQSAATKSAGGPSRPRNLRPVSGGRSSRPAV